MTELWTDARNPENLQVLPNLKVSNNGNLKRLAHTKTVKAGHEREYKERMMALKPARNGYIIWQNFLIHRLVWVSFHNKPIPLGHVIHHKDNNRINNKLNNLQLMTISENNKTRNKKKGYKNTGYTGYKPPIKLIKNESEIWKQVSWDLKYEVSDTGRVAIIKKNQELRKTLSHGYEQVTLSKKQKWLVHRLIWTVFHGNIEEKYVIDHIDGNRENNNLKNLKKCYQSENISNAIKRGHLNPGSKSLSDRAKLDELLKKGMNNDEIIDLLNFSRSHINKRRRDIGLTQLEFSDAKLKKKALMLLKAGSSIKNTANATGLDVQYVRRLSSKHGYSIPPKRITKNECQSIIHSLNNDHELTFKQIADKYSVSKPTVIAINKKEKIRTERRGKRLVKPGT